MAETALGFLFGVRAQTEMKIWCVKHMLRIASSENKIGVKGLNKLYLIYLF